MTEMAGIPVSAPGAMSTRTDLARQPIRDIPGGQWGEGKELREIQAGAPMAAVPPPRPIDLFAPTERRDEPVTAGIDFGDGPGSEVLPGLAPGSSPAPGSISEKLARMVAEDPSGDAERMLAIAQRLGW